MILNSLGERSRNCWYLNTKDLVLLTGLSKSTIDRLESRGQFPQRVTLSTQRVGWIVEEVDAWRKERDKDRKRKKIDQWEAARRSIKGRLSTVR